VNSDHLVNIKKFITAKERVNSILKYVRKFLLLRVSCHYIIIYRYVNVDSNSSLDVYICCVNSPSLFYVHAADSVPRYVFIFCMRDLVACGTC
jgi:hypothetical protein